MCRLLAYVGAPITVASVVTDPPHSLQQQVRHPRHQAVGQDNPDGYGIGWYPAGDPGGPVPLPDRLRRARPLDLDPAVDAVLGYRATALLAAIRNATPPLPVEEAGSAPFRSGPWLFAHNGSVDRFRTGAEPVLRRRLTTARQAGIEGASDSEVVFGLILDALADGQAPGGALVGAVAAIDEVGGGRATFLLTDGVRIHGTVRGNGLWALVGAGPAADGVVVASEPFDDDPAWTPLPEGCLLEATPSAVTHTPLASALAEAGVTP